MKIIPLSYIGSVILYIGVFWLSAAAAKVNTQNKLLKAALICFLPFLLAGFRYNVGWDYGSYLRGYELCDSSVPIIDLIRGYQFGKFLGLEIIQNISKKLDSHFLFFAVTSAFAFVPAVLYLLKDWKDRSFPLSLSIFCSGFLLYPTGLSAIKQGAAIGFCVYSLTYVYQRKPIHFLLCMVAAILFHPTAIVFLPVYFFINMREQIQIWKKVLVIAATVLAVNFWGILAGILGERFEAYSGMTVITNNRMFYLTLFWSVMFLVFYKRLVALDSRNDLLITMYIIGAILMLTGFTNAFVKRIASYYTVVEILLLPQMTLLFDRKSRKIVNALLAIYVVAVFLLLNSGTAENMAPVPYSFVFWS